MSLHSQLLPTDLERKKLEKSAAQIEKVTAELKRVFYLIHGKVLAGRADDLSFSRLDKEIENLINQAQFVFDIVLPIAENLSDKKKETAEDLEFICDDSEESDYEPSEEGEEISLLTDDDSTIELDDEHDE